MQRKFYNATHTDLHSSFFTKAQQPYSSVTFSEIIQTFNIWKPMTKCLDSRGFHFHSPPLVFSSVLYTKMSSLTQKHPQAHMHSKIMHSMNRLFVSKLCISFSMCSNMSLCDPQFIDWGAHWLDGKKVSLEDVCWRCCAVSEGSTILASMGIYFKVKLNSPPKDDCFHEGHRKKNFNLVGQNSHTAASL